MDFFHTERHTLLLLGCTVSSREWVSELLADSYDIQLPLRTKEALQTLAGEVNRPSLILLENKTPMADRAEIFHQLKSRPETWNIPVVLFGKPETPEEEVFAFEQGAADFLVMPLNPDIFKAKIKARLGQIESNNVTQLINKQLEVLVARRVADIGTVQDVAIMAMTGLAKTRDTETGNHICRTQHYVLALCDALQAHPRFAPFLTEKYVNILFKSAPLHDIGKVGIPDHILFKPGRLDPEEMETMRTHTTQGRDAIDYAESLLAGGRGFLTIARELAYSHHEKWDGSGYPQGLAGDDIPIAARLMAVADVYDAITSRRVYKPDMPHDTAVDLIIRGKGLHFDPDVVDAFLSIPDKFNAIACSYADAEPSAIKASAVSNSKSLIAASMAAACG